MKERFGKGILWVVIGGGVVIVVAIAFYAYYVTLVSPIQDEQVVSETSPYSFSEYVNKKGEVWRLSQEPVTEFTVASPEGTYPKFVSGKIEPLDVKPGDIQKLEVVIEDNVSLERVWAEIEQDHGTTTLDLVLKDTKALTLADIESRPFFVRENGELVPNNSRVSGVALEVFKKAQAQSIVLYTYVGEWTVFDTHSRDYITIFRARDIQGRENLLTMAWSDSCTPPLNGNWTTGQSCSVTTATGVDNGNLTVSVGTLTISTGGTVAFNSGKTVTISSQITFAGGQLKQTNLWITDGDGDNYAPSSYSTKAQDSEPTSYSRRYSISGTNDCYDLNANAYPGQTGWFSANRGDGSFDYNCNTTIEYLQNNRLCTAYLNGWNIGPPQCGGSGGGYCAIVGCVDCSPQSQACH